jgi:hypothetical protein
MGGLPADEQPWSGRTHSLMIELPPLATVAFKLERQMRTQPAAAETNEAEAAPAIEP